MRQKPQQLTKGGKVIKVASIKIHLCKEQGNVVRSIFKMR